MAQTGYTPISLYYSTTPSQQPVNTNLVSGELALNITDGKLYYKDNTGTVQLLAAKGGGVGTSSDTQILFNSSNTVAGSSSLTWSGTVLSTTGFTASSDSSFTSTGALKLPSGTTAQQPTGVAGKIRFNTDTSIFEGYNGTTWAGIGATSTYTRTSFTATAGQTVFSVAYTVGFLQIYLNGVLLNSTDYTASNGTSFTLSSAASSGDIVEAVAYSVVAIGTTANLIGGTAGVVPYQSGVSTTSFTAAGTTGQAFISGGTGSPTWGTLGTGAGGTGLTTVGTNGQVLTSNGTSLTWTTPTTGTVTSVTGTSPVASSGGATPAISLASNYGDTQNPYASKTANYFLAAPNGSTGSPSFRAIVAADIPTLNQSTTGSAGSVANALTIGTGLKLSSGTTYNGSAALTLNAVGTVINSQTSGYTLVAGDAGKTISITTGGVTVPNSVMSAGDIVTIYNNSGSSQTITQASGLTLQWAGQSGSSTGNRTLGLYGICTVVFITASNAVISGAGLT